MRAFYFEGLPSAEVAWCFGYSPGAFRVLCHAFRHGVPEFFAKGLGENPRALTVMDLAEKVEGRERSGRRGWRKTRTG